MKYQSSKSGHKRRKHTTTLSKARRNPPDNDSQNVGGVETKKVKTGPYSYALSEIEKATASKKKPSELLENFLMKKNPKGRLVTSTETVRTVPGKGVGRGKRTKTKTVQKRVPYDRVMYKKALLAILNYAKSYGSISQAQLEEFKASIQGATVENSQAAEKACSLLGVVLPSKTVKVAQSEDTYVDSGSGVDFDSGVDSDSGVNEASGKGMSTTAKLLAALLGVGAIGIGIYAYKKAK